MAITTSDGLVAGLANGKKVTFFIPSGTSVVGGWTLLNKLTSSFGSLANPAAFGSGGTTYNKTAGVSGYPFWQTGASNAYLAKMAATFATLGSVNVYDVVWACSGFNSTLLTAQIVAGFSGLPTRATGGVGLEIWYVSNTITGATASNITVSYTNQAAVAGRTTVATANIASAPVGRMQPLPLQAGDSGVQSIQSLTFSASTGTAGDIGLMLLERVATISAPIVNVSNILDFTQLGLPEITDSACLMFVHQATTTSTGIILGDMAIAQG